MTTSEQQIYQALTNAGLSQIQAAGVMGNMQNESDFNVEAAAVDSNGAKSYGLIQWNAASYPGASSLVTGNPTRDLTDQIDFLLHDTSGTSQGLKGSTAAQVAGNWANYVEICQGCTPGGAQNVQRQANANTILQEAQSGNWGPGGPGINGGQIDTTSALSGFPPFPFNLPGIFGAGNGSNNPLSNNPLITGIGEGIASGTVSAFTSITNTMLKKLGFTGWKDFFIRMGFITLGAIVLIIGLTHLTEKNTQISLPTSSGSNEDNSSRVQSHGKAADSSSAAHKFGKDAVKVAEVAAL